MTSASLFITITAAVPKAVWAWTNPSKSIRTSVQTLLKKKGKYKKVHQYIGKDTFNRKKIDLNISTPNSIKINGYSS